MLQFVFKPIFKFFKIFLILWLVLSGVLLFVSDGIIYLDEFSHGVVPRIAFQQEFTKTPSGIDIDMRWLPKASTTQTILYLHGNGGRGAEYVVPMSQNYQVLAPAYPQYGKSGPGLNEKTVLESAVTAYNWLLAKGIPAQNITILGHSLGGAVATFLAAQVKEYKALVLINTFSSMQSMCWRSFTILCGFGNHIWNTANIAPQVTGKVYMFTSLKDEQIPYSEQMLLPQYFTGTSPRIDTITTTGHNDFSLDYILGRIQAS
jgi:pimeloyl-ACP methyl ester carboxylesterase